MYHMSATPTSLRLTVSKETVDIPEGVFAAIGGGIMTLLAIVTRGWLKRRDKQHEQSPKLEEVLVGGTQWTIKNLQEQIERLNADVELLRKAIDMRDQQIAALRSEVWELKSQLRSQGT